MMSLPTPTGTNLRRVGVAAVFAAALVMGTTTSTLADPGEACATTGGGIATSMGLKPFDKSGYLECADLVSDLFEQGHLTRDEWQQETLDCCYENGGEMRLDESGIAECYDPAEGPQHAPAPPQGPVNQAPPGPNQPTLAPQPPPPPTGPVTPGPGLPPVQTR